MKPLYNSFSFPYIEHCLEVWYRKYPSDINPVYVLQKKAIRITFNAHHNEHTNKSFTMKLNVLKLFHLLIYETSFTTYKAIDNSLPQFVCIYVWPGAY